MESAPPARERRQDNVPVEKPGPHPLLLRLGRELKRRREATGCKRPETAKKVRVDGSTLFRAEEGRNTPNVRLVEDLCDLYEVSPATRGALLDLLERAKTPPWWAVYNIPKDFGLCLTREEDAASIDWFELGLVPGLLQTEDYARTVIAAGPNTGDIEARIELRMKRQDILNRPSPPALSVVIPEEVLYRPVGGWHVHARQAESLLRATEQPNISLQVVPRAAGYYRGLTAASFQVHHAAPDSDGTVREPTAVYAESLSGSTYREDPSEVFRYTEAFDDIREAALGPEESRTTIKHAIEEARQHHV